MARKIAANLSVQMDRASSKSNLVRLLRMATNFPDLLEKEDILLCKLEEAGSCGGDLLHKLSQSVSALPLKEADNNLLAIRNVAGIVLKGCILLSC